MFWIYNRELLDKQVTKINFDTWLIGSKAYLI